MSALTSRYHYLTQMVRAVITNTPENINDATLMNVARRQRAAAAQLTQIIDAFIRESTQAPRIPECTADRPFDTTVSYLNSWRHPDAVEFPIAGRNPVRVCPHCQPEMYRKTMLRFNGCPPEFMKD